LGPESSTTTQPHEVAGEEFYVKPVEEMARIFPTIRRLWRTP
jgi:hypothetical protein